MSADWRSCGRRTGPAAFLLAAMLLLAGCVTGGGGADAVRSWPFPNGESVGLGSRYRPVDAQDPAPAVVLLHGCGGWHGDNITRWASFFNARGYHALAVDSFGPRGYSQGVCNRFPSPPVTLFDRVHDAYGALDWLASRPEVDPSRIVVSGYSYGGSTSLSAVRAGREPRDFPDGLAFRAAIPFYPYCGLDMIALRLSAPTLIVIGEKDDWTPARPCVTAGQGYKGPPLFRTHVIPGAYHSFDQFTWRGRPVGSRNYLGHVLEPSMSAVREAERVIDAFLREIGLPAGESS